MPETDDELNRKPRPRTIVVPTIPLPPKRVENAFYMRCGKGLANWAQLEAVLADWFVYLCNAEGAATLQMRVIFYSARSFHGSADMLKAAFYGATRKEDLSDFFRTAINRTMSYYAFRNKLAHFLPAYLGPKTGMVLLDPAHIPIKTIVAEKEVVIASVNFMRLMRVWSFTRPRTYPTPGLTPTEGLRRIEALPAEAHSRELSQKQKGRRYQRLVRPASPE